MKRELVRTITAKEGKGLVSYINRVDDSYYEVIYSNKSEYLTNSIDAAIVVAKIIIIYHQNLQKCNELLYKTHIPEEKRWDNILELLREEYKKSPIDQRISLKLYGTLDNNYYELKNAKTEDDIKRLSIVATIRAKDNLMEAVYEITSAIEPSIAYKNYNRYLDSRNPYIEGNPYLGLKTLKVKKEDYKNGQRVNSAEYAKQTA